MMRLLCVTAHPDDEAGAFGGALYLYGLRGVQTTVLCLTPGTAATHRGNTRSPEELAETRRREFAASCKILGVGAGEVLQYPDGGLDRLELHAAVADLTRRIRILRPHVVITFGSEGAFTAHPDHSMASVFATLAFQWAARTNRFPEQLAELKPWRAQKLYYSTVPFTVPERQPVALAPATAVLEIDVEVKRAAFHAHLSQSPLFPIFDATLAQRGHEEQYHLAAASRPGRVAMENDLFDGVVED